MIVAICQPERFVTGLNFLCRTSTLAQGQAKVALDGTIGLIFVVGISLTIICLGIYAIWHGVAEQTEAGKAKFRRDSMAAFGYVKPPIHIYYSLIAISIGVALVLAGIVLTAVLGSKALAVNTPTLSATEFTKQVPASPSPSMQQIASAPIREQPLADAPHGPASSFNEQPADRNEPPEPPPIVVVPSSGQPKTNEMEPSSVPEEPASTTTSPLTESSQQLPTKLPPITRYKIELPLPDGALIVEPETSLRPGMKLGAVWARKWNDVTVDVVHDDGTVEVSWDGWGTHYRMVREDLAIAKTDAQPPDTVPRVWTDASGKFSIAATYVDSKAGYVLLKKKDGKEVSILIEKLSREDRELIRQLAQQNANR